MNKTNRSSIASSLVLLAIFFNFHCVSAQIPKLFLKFVENQNKVQSGYVALQFIYMTEDDTTFMRTEEAFFISTPKDIKYLSCQQDAFTLSILCKSTHARVAIKTWKNFELIRYDYDDRIFDAKADADIIGDFSYPLVYDLSFLSCEDFVYQRIIPKQNKKNIRYKIVYPDDNCGSNRTGEWEFEKKTFNLIQNEYLMTYFNTERIYGKIDILEQRLYNYIHPDILDTITFKFEEIKKGYDRQCAAEQAKKDSAYKASLCDSIAQSITKNGAKWAEKIPQEVQEETLFFMPEWKFPLLSGDTIYSDSIRSQFLLIDMWYVNCHPCRLAMHELTAIDTLYNESLLKMVSLNVSDKDTAKISQVVRNFNLKCDVACAFNNGYDIVMSKQMGNCQGYPQLYLVDMKTKQVIWYSCGYYAGFTKDIEEIIIAYNENKN